MHEDTVPVEEVVAIAVTHNIELNLEYARVKLNELIQLQFGRLFGR